MVNKLSPPIKKQILIAVEGLRLFDPLMQNEPLIVARDSEQITISYQVKKLYFSTILPLYSLHLRFKVYQLY